MNLLDYVKERGWETYSQNADRYLTLIIDDVDDAMEEYIKLVHNFGLTSCTVPKADNLKKNMEINPANRTMMKKIKIKINLTNKQITNFWTVFVNIDKQYNNYEYVRQGIREPNFIRRKNQFMKLLIGE